MEDDHPPWGVGLEVMYEHVFAYGHDTGLWATMASIHSESPC
jgi:hypothetical protein